MLFREIAAVYSEIQNKHETTGCRQSSKFWKVKLCDIYNNQSVTKNLNVEREGTSERVV
jgi:hypothetical protein